eukprot:TRINITY_DN13226_c0_g4_i1.p5 TRINITY_DN13226_c0_g4~~TRINITY_DN13226_c0_g4_i1.p5  ORF type:complete len:111 (+),score=29.78 TRINITY_DN13226_c0_g4_i1:74-406(+)
MGAACCGEIEVPAHDIDAPPPTAERVLPREPAPVVPKFHVPMFPGWEAMIAWEEMMHSVLAAAPLPPTPPPHILTHQAAASTPGARCGKVIGRIAAGQAARLIRARRARD